MQDPKTEKPVQHQPANDRPVGGQGVERGEEQPGDKNRALRNK